MAVIKTMSHILQSKIYTRYNKTFRSGLDKLHNALSGRGCRLRIDMWGFDDDHAFAEYKLDHKNCD